MSRPLRIAISHGDFNGIGYEVIFKAIAAEGFTDLCTPVIFGSSDLAAATVKQLKFPNLRFQPLKRASDARDGQINVVDVCDPSLEVTPGHPSPQAGKAAVDSLLAACNALEAGEVDILVTAPINKRTAFDPERFPFPGHTEFLQNRLGGDGSKSLMILFNDEIRVALVTTHLPLSKVPEQITRANVLSTIRRMNDALILDFAMERPKIAVLSLNPHNGDNGLLGSEEETEIIPAIKDAVDEKILAFGPFAADGFFGTGAFRNYDGIVAMYHDQGLAPFKALAREYGVNYTAGLPFVRTSPDHGSGYDIAGKNIADGTSMREAIYKGIDIFRNRRFHQHAAANPLRRHRLEKTPDKTIDLSKDEL